MSRSSSEKEMVGGDGVNARSSTTLEIEGVVGGDGVNAGRSTTLEIERAVAGKSGDDDIIKYIPLYRALVKGDLESMTACLDEDPEAISAKISTIGETPLHIAVSHGHHKLAMELLDRIRHDEEKLSKKDDYGETPLHIAARGVNLQIARELVYRSETLMGLEDADGQVPLTLAAIYDNKKMLETLGWKRLHDAVYGSRNMLSRLGSKRRSDTHHPTDFDDSKIHKWTLFNEFILSKRFGLHALVDCMENMLDDVCTSQESPHSIFEGVKYIYLMVLRFLKGFMFCVLIVPAAVLIGVTGMILKIDIKKENENAYKLLSFMCSPKWTFDSKHVGVYFEAIKRAIKCGNVEFVEEVLRSNPALLWGNKESGTIFHIALAFRQEKIWNLIYGLSVEQKNKIIGILVESNNMLHIAAFPIITAKTKGVPTEASKIQHQGEQQFWKEFSKAPGAAMKVQRELQWYKEVEGMVPSSYRIRPNGNGETPHALFTTWHSKLVKEGEQWMRDTATSCTIVATLIVTVMFAAAFTLPGGNYDQSENSWNSKSAHAGNPRFLWRNSFMIFVISDALSLFSSVTAVLMFLSILTSRFEEKDFLNALPMRLIIGLATLFLSIASMMVTFGVTLVIVFSERIRWTVVPVTVLASFPVTLFVFLQFPLFVDMASSTYVGIFIRKKKCSFFNNPNEYFPEKKTNNNVDDKESEV